MEPAASATVLVAAGYALSVQCRTCDTLSRIPLGRGSAMPDRPFVHLHCHTHYSLLDGASRIPELVAHVKKLGMNAVALTDHGNLYGAIEFYRECKAAGINPIIGYEAYVAPGKRTDREARRRGDAGYPPDAAGPEPHRLQEPHQDGVRRLPRGLSLRPAHRQGAARSPQRRAHLPERLRLQRVQRVHPQGPDWTRRRSWPSGSHKLFGKNFYVEIQNNGLDIQQLCAEGAIDIANQLGLPLVATCDAHYLTPGRRRRPRRAAVHQHRQDAATTRTACATAATSSTSAPPEEMYALFPEPRRRRPAQPGDRRRLRHRARLQEAALPRLHAARQARRRRTTCASCARRACTSATAPSRRRRCATGSSTSWASSAGWASPATS